MCVNPESNSSLVSKVYGTNAEEVEGNIVVTADQARKSITVISKQHAVLEFRAYDNINKGLVFDNADSSASDYETDGVTWMSTTNNATVYTEANGLDFEIEARATITDGDFTDRAFWILLDDFTTSVWDVPTVKINGATLSEASADMDANERRAWSDYDYVYRSTKSIKDAGDSVKVTVIDSLLAGASATTDLEIDFASEGAYLSKDGINVYEGASRDDTSATTVYAIQDNNIDIT